jgi:hypothetical protein
VIRVDAVRLAVEPRDLRIGMESALARVVAVFGAAQPHHAYSFTNRRVNRIKVLVHDGFGPWLAMRRLHRLGIRPFSEEKASLFPVSVDKPDQLLRPRVASRRFIAARDEFGLRGFRFHDLRHQHVSILLRTLALPEVAERAGRANPAVTARIYAHVVDDAHQRGADVVAAMLSKRLQSAWCGDAGTKGYIFRNRSTQPLLNC